jgi:hypothetical protein
LAPQTRPRNCYFTSWCEPGLAAALTYRVSQ